MSDPLAPSVVKRTSCQLMRACAQKVRSRPILCVVALLVVAWSSPPSAAAQTIYRCVSHGQTTLQDQPCDGTAAPRPSTPNDAAPRVLEHAEGTWQGTLNVSLSVAGKTVGIQPPLAALRLDVAPDGSLTGATREGGCQLAGRIASRYNAATLALDIRLTRCTQPALNLRYSGDLVLKAAGQPVHLALTGLSGFVEGKSESTVTLLCDLLRGAPTQTGPGVSKAGAGLP